MRTITKIREEMTVEEFASVQGYFQKMILGEILIELGYLNKKLIVLDAAARRNECIRLIRYYTSECIKLKGEIKKMKIENEKRAQILFDFIAKMEKREE